jgi:hypothetical protein
MAAVDDLALVCPYRLVESALGDGCLEDSIFVFGGGGPERPLPKPSYDRFGFYGALWQERQLPLDRGLLPGTHCVKVLRPDLATSLDVFGAFLKMLLAFGDIHPAEFREKMLLLECTVAILLGPPERANAIFDIVRAITAGIPGPQIISELSLWMGIVIAAVGFKPKSKHLGLAGLPRKIPADLEKSLLAPICTVHQRISSSSIGANWISAGGFGCLIVWTSSRVVVGKTQFFRYESREQLGQNPHNAEFDRGPQTSHR